MVRITTWNIENLNYLYILFVLYHNILFSSILVYESKVRFINLLCLLIDLYFYPIWGVYSSNNRSLENPFTKGIVFWKDD